MDKEELKRYAEYCGDNALKEMGMKPNWNIVVNPLPYMDDAVGTVLTDFFSGRVTDYTKQVQGSWDQVTFDNWEA